MPKEKIKFWYDTVMEYALYGIVILVPAIFLPDFYTVFSAPKLLVLRLLTLLILVCWGCKIYVEGKLHYVKNWLNVGLIAFGLSAILSTLFSVNIWTSLIGTEGRFVGLTTTLNFLFLSFFALNILREKKLAIRFLKMSVVVASVLALYGIFQYFGLFQEAFNWNQNPTDRVFGTVGHGNHFGAYLGMNLMIGIFLFSQIKSWFWRLLLALGTVLQIVCLFMTESRGALIATFIAVIATAVFLLAKERKKLRISFSKVLLGIFVVGAISVSGLIIFGEDFAKIPFVERSLQTIELAQQGMIPDRLSWWMSAMKMAEDRPFFGFGLSTFRDVYNQYRRPDYATLESDGMQDMITPEAAHNEFLNIAAAQGWIGLGAFFVILLLVFWRISSYCWKTDQDYGLALGVGAALLVYLLQVFVSFGVITTLTIFYLFLGIGIVLAEEKIIMREIIFPRTGKVFVAIMVIIGVCGGAYITVREARAEMEYKTALLENAKGNIEGAIEHFQNMIELKPQDFSGYQNLGDFALKNAGTQQNIVGLKDDFVREKMVRLAVTNYQEALNVNKFHPSTWYNLGVSELQLYAFTSDDSHYINAGKAFAEAINSSPNNPLYPYQIAVSYMVFGFEDAREKALLYLEYAQEIRPNYRDTQKRIDQLKGVLNTALDQSATAGIATP